MLDIGSGKSSLAVRVVYDDSSLVELEARVFADDWSGSTWAYTDSLSLRSEARGLLDWTEHPQGTFALEAGADTGIGWLSLRWYATDRAGHLACHVQFATRAINDRPEGVRRLSLELPTETGLVERFARQLLSIAETFSGEARLEGV